MATDDRTYVIDPAATDPELVRSLMPLGEDPGPPPRRAGTRRKRRETVDRDVASLSPPPRPGLWLTGALLAGPFAILLDAGSIPRWLRWTAVAAAVIPTAVATWIWTQEPGRMGGGDRAVLGQAVAVAVAAASWLTVSCVGLLLAAGRCPEGPLARRGQRRPVAAGLAGLAVPGLGLLLAGRSWRCATTLLLVGCGGTAGLALWRAGDWWAWHRSQPTLLRDLQLEQAFLVIAGLIVIGALAWLVSALEAGRLAAGPRVVRAVSSADRVPAALLLALVALGIGFRPLDAAHELDRLTDRLVTVGLRLTPLCTARAAAFLAPAEPVFEWRVAERHAALGHADTAAAIRQRLRRRWDRLQASDLAERSPVTGAATAVDLPPTDRRPATTRAPAPFSPPIASADAGPPPPPAR